MYLYVYDSFLNNKKYSNLLARIETRLTDFGIGGRILRLSPLRNTVELLNDEIKNGMKTVVIVGNDKTLAHVINIISRLDITIGIIPVGPDNKIARLLGVNSPEDACNILSARKIESIDLGKANDTYFISSITVDQGDVAISCEDKFVVRPESSNNTVGVYNLRPVFAASWGPKNLFSPRDGKLEVLIQPLKTSWWTKNKTATGDNSIIPFEKITIRSKGKSALSVFTDGQKILKTPVQVEVIPKKLKVVVGKDRLF